VVMIALFGAFAVVTGVMLVAASFDAVKQHLHWGSLLASGVLSVVAGLVTWFWPGLTAGFHLPATVVPIGTTNAGLPLGVQITGPIYGDRMTLMAASLFEQAGYGFQPPALG